MSLCHRLLLLCQAFLVIAPNAALGAQGLAPTLEQGLGLFQARQFEEARAVFRSLAKRDDVQGIYWLGRTEYAVGATSAAIEQFEKAVRIDDRNSQYHLWLGRGYGEAAQHANVFRQPTLARRTRIEWERAVALDSTNVEARSDLVSFYLMAPGIMGGSQDKAQLQAAAIHKINPYLGALELARVYIARRDSAAAETQFRTLLRIFPDSAVPRIRLVTQLVAQQKWGAAFALCDDGLARLPQNPSLLFQLGKTSALSGQRLDAGDAALRRYLSAPAVRGDPTHASAHYRLGMIAEKRGDKSGAQSEYEAALALDPKHEDARRALRQRK